MLPLILNDYLCRWYANREGLKPLAIVMHGTVGVDSRAYLVNGGGRQVSIHYLIQKLPRKNGTIDIDPNGRLAPTGCDAVIYQMLDDRLAANHCGYSRLEIGGKTYWSGSISPNKVTFGIELENLQDGKDAYTEPQLLAMGYVINMLRAKYGALPIFRHEDIDTQGKRDPVNLSVSDIEHWANRASIVYGDIWSLWGTDYPLNKDWGIPQVWYTRARLMGGCVSPETYFGNVVIQNFANGFCVYSLVTKRAKAFLYTEI